MRLGLLRKRIVMVCLALSFTFPMKALAATDMEVLSYDKNVSPGNVLEPDHSYGDGELGEAVQTDEEKRTNGVELQQDAVNTSETFNDLIYEVTAEGAIKIIDYVGSAEYLEIPDNINGKQVVHIGNNAFAYTDLKEIKIPDSVTSIGDNAFEYCNNLSELIIPDSVVNIGRDIFSYCNNLTKIYFPKKIDSLGDWTCENFINLTEIKLPYGITEIPRSAFKGCVKLNQAIIPESVSIIKDDAFSGCTSLFEINISENVTKIGYSAFENCTKLIEITIPSSVTSMGYGALNSCGLQKINFSGSVVRNLSIRFYEMKELREINIMDGVHTIEDKAFWDCGFQKISIPDSVINIGKEAFNNSDYNSCFIYGNRGSYAEIYAKNNKIAYVAYEEGEIEKYTVSSADDLISVLGSYRHIVLKDGIYDIYKDLDLSHLVSVIIEAENPGKVEIISRDSYAPVVNIYNAANIEIKGCILGHRPLHLDGCGPEAYVVNAQYSFNINISNCDLYGCGIESLGYYNANDIVVKDCIVRDCMRKITSGNGNNVKFVNCIISGNAYDETFAAAYCAVTGPAFFDNCTFLNNYSTTFQQAGYENAKLNNCIFSDNAWDGMKPEAYGICINGITWQVDGDYLKLGYPLVLNDGTIVESGKGKILEYSEISLPWKKYQYKERIFADGIESNIVEEKFEDIDKSAWYVSAVQYVYDNGMMSGKTNKTFEPNASLTRAEFATVLHNLEAKPAVGYQAVFSDVKEGQWYTSPVLWAYEKELVSGYPNGKYGVSDKIQREQLALMLYKYAKLKGYDMSSKDYILSGYTDIDRISGWAKEAMQWAVTHGIMSGKGNSSDPYNYRLDPTGNATRAECASMMKKLFTMSK